MPVNDHLVWNEIKDFAGGLNDGNDFLMPANEFQVLEDCYPRPGGGLRAFYKASTTTITTAGLSMATERIEMIVPFIESTGIAYMAVTKNTTTGLQKWYTLGIGAGSWTLRKTFTAPVSLANSSLTQVTTYNTGAGIRWAICTSHNKSDSTEDGLYTMTDTGTIAFIEQSGFNTVAMTQYQARLLYAKLNTLVWTDPGSIVAPPAPNFITLQTGNNDVRDIIAVIVPYAPTTLIIGTIGSGWWMIEGDITDPVVRQMADDHYPGKVQRGTRTEDGVVFFEPNNGIYKTRNMAAQFERLDQNLIPHAVDENQAFSYFDNFLFAPGGKVMNTDTKTWFSLSAATGANVVNHWERQPTNTINGVTLGQQVIGAQRNNAGAILSYPVNEFGGQRVETFRVKTAPIRNDKGRYMHIREVQVAVDCFGSTSTVAITVNGTTRTSATLPAGTNEVSFLFDERAKYLDVLVVPNSNTTNTEAPVLEAVRIGTRPDAHQVT